MLFNNVPKSEKIQILEEVIPKYEKNVYHLLVQLAIDPITFDEDNFEEEDPLVNEDDFETKAFRNKLKKELDAIRLIKQEITSLEA